MPTYASKVDVLFEIQRLNELGKFDEAMKLQKVFIGSLKQDQRNKRFSSNVTVGRREKKTLDGLGIPIKTRSSKKIDSLQMKHFKKAVHG